MNLLRRLRAHQSWLAVGSVGGLLIVVMIAGAVGITVNERGNDAVQRALLYDVQLEDVGDDLRAAVLDLRHYHRNILFAGPSRGGLNDFEAAYAHLHEQIDELDQLDMTEEDESVPQPADLRAMAEQYYAEFRPMIDLYSTDPDAFIVANDEGLIRLEELGAAANVIDALGEQHAAEALANAERSSRTARFNLIIVLAGLVLVGAVLAWLVIHTVNEIRGLYKEQQDTSRQLAQALSSKNDFIADASHELRTPLTVLRGNAEVGLELDRECVHRPILEDIVRESERMTRLVEDLLFLARSDTGSLPLDVARVDAGSLLPNLVEAAEMLARQYGTTLRLDLSADEGVLEVDAARIEQAVLILVDNAAKYGASGGPITLKSRTRRGELVISVTDRGPGIPEEDLPHIFERFYRVDKTRGRKRGGSGLGLSIARSIAEAHHGRLEARSRVNEGTTMTLYLPLATTEPAARATETVTPRVATGDTP